MPRDSLLSGRMILAQTKAFLNKKKRISIAKQIIHGAAHNMQKNLQYYNRRGKDLDGLLEDIGTFTESINNALDTEELMGVEGNIRQVYYEAFNIILNDLRWD